jgi:hypothetical protein
VGSGNVTLSEKKFKKISHFFHSKMGKFWVFLGANRLILLVGLEDNFSISQNKRKEIPGNK